MIFRLFVAALMLLCGSGVARAEYILRLPNLPDIRFENAETENTSTPLIISADRKGFDWTKNLNLDERKIFEEILRRQWSVIRPKEKVLTEVDVKHYGPDSSRRDHKMIFYTTHSGVLIANGKEIIFPYSQIMIDKNHLRFFEPYRACFRDITPHRWLPDEPRLYASIRMKIRGTVDRLETDEPFVWEGKVSSVRFMDVYLRDITVLKIDCR